MGRSWHLAMGTDIEVASMLNFKVDVWGRQYEDSVREVPAQAPVLGSGWAYGAEFFGQFRLKERLFSWASLSLMRAQENEGTSPFDQPFAFNFVLSWRPVSHWDFGLRYRYAAGMPYSPPVGSVYDASLDIYMPTYDIEPSGRLPDYQKIDLHISRKFLYKRWKFTTYAELWWVPKQANYLYPIYNYDYSDDQLVVGPPIFPLVGLRVER